MFAFSSSVLAAETVGGALRRVEAIAVVGTLDVGGIPHAFGIESA